MLVDASAPLPPAGDDTQAIDTDRVRVEQHCDEPLERFRVVLEGTARGTRRPLRARCAAKPGEPVEIALDLTWETDGVPYPWRLATRYEIPCRVTGTVRIGDEDVALAGPGQRDHSWGARDWWAIGLDVERAAPRRRHPHPRGRRSRPIPTSASATSSAATS